VLSLTVRTKVGLLIAAACLSMVALSAVLIKESRKRIFDFHLENTKTALAATLAMLELDQSLVDTGELSVDMARARALERLRKFRYNNGEGYVAVVLDDGYMPLHPVHENLDQQNVWDLQDSTGAYITRDIIRIGREQGIGVNRYYFENPLTGKNDIKTSAVGRFEPWGWTLIAGVFDQSIDLATEEMLRRALVVVISMSGLFLVFGLAIGRSISVPISKLTDSMTAIASGKLDAQIPCQSLRNESGKMARALAIFRDRGVEIIELQARREETNREIENERKQVALRLREQFGDVLHAANRGEFSYRMATDAPDENLAALAEMLNTFVGTVDKGVSAVRLAMSSMSQGKCPTQHEDNFQGAFKDMLAHVTSTAEAIQNQTDRLEFAVLHDPLTDLPNRRFFEKQLDAHCSQIGSANSISVLQIDLDHFKKINDAFGHIAGNEVLRHTAERLRNAMPAPCFIARIGGNEFALILNDLEFGQSLDNILAEILRKIKDPVKTRNGTAKISASIGAVRFNSAGANAKEILKQLSMALLQAKRKRRGAYYIFSPELEAAQINRERIGDDILRGLEKQEFFPYFQPQIDARTKKMAGVEALARWRHPEHGILSPDRFLPIAEEMGVTSQIDAQVFKSAATTIKHLNQQDSAGIEKLSVNVSLPRLMDEDLLRSFDEVDMQGCRLAVELLESIAYDDQSDLFEYRIDILRERGIEIEIDDFGTGRASITSLIKVAPHRLKVDRALVRPIVSSNRQRLLICSIVEIAKTFNIGVVAEGVETMQHADLLRDMDVDILQGFALARPLSDEGLMKYIRNNEGIDSTYTQKRPAQ